MIFPQTRLLHFGTLPILPHYMRRCPACSTRIDMRGNKAALDEHIAQEHSNWKYLGKRFKQIGD